MKWRPVVVLAGLIAFNSQAPAQDKDSLARRLTDFPARDSSRVKTLLQLARIEYAGDQKKMIALTTEAIDIAEETHFDNGLVKGYSYLGIYAKATPPLAGVCL